MATKTKSKSSSTKSKSGGAKSSTKKSSPKRQREWPVQPNTVDPPNEKVDGSDVTKLDQGLDDLEVAQLDGAYAVLRLGKEKRLVGQADLQNAIKKLAKAVQLTY